MNPVASRFRADVKDRIANAGRLAEEDLVPAHQPECERVNEWVERISVVESDFAAYRRHAKSIAIVGNAAYYPGQQ